MSTPEEPKFLVPQITVIEEQTIAKAIIAGVTAFATGYATAMADASITATEWVTLGAGTVVAALSVWAVTNKPN